MAGPLAFGALYLPGKFTHEPAPLHRLLERTWMERPGQVAVVGPSDSAKSTFARTALTWDALFLRWFLFGVVVGPTETIACEMLEPIRAFFESAFVRDDFGDLRGEQWNDHAIEIIKPFGRGETCRIAAWYPGGDVKGRLHETAGKSIRPQTVLEDDAERKLEQGSEALLARYQTFLWDELLPRMDWSAGARSLFWRSANLANERSSVGKMFQDYPYIDPATGELYAGEPLQTPQYAEWRRIRVDCYTRDGGSYWESRWPVPTLQAMERRLAGNPGAFARQYRSDPRAGGVMPFDPALFVEARCYGRAPMDGADARALFPGVRIVMAVDDAEAIAKHNDYTAWAITGRHRGRVLVFEMGWDKIPLGQQEGRLLGLWQKWLPEALVGESKRLLLAILNLGRAQDPPQLVATEHISRANVNKHARICGMNQIFYDGHATFPVGHQDWRNRLIGYYDGVDHDDPEDALETAITKAMSLGSDSAVSVDATPLDADPLEEYRRRTAYGA